MGEPRIPKLPNREDYKRYNPQPVPQASPSVRITQFLPRQSPVVIHVPTAPAGDACDICEANRINEALGRGSYTLHNCIILNSTQQAAEQARIRGEITVIPEYRREGEPYSFSVGGKPLAPYTGRTWEPKLLYMKETGRLLFIRPFRHFIGIYELKSTLSRVDRRKEWLAKKKNKPKIRETILSQISFLTHRLVKSTRDYVPVGEMRRFGLSSFSIYDDIKTGFDVFINCNQSPLKYYPHRGNNVDTSLPDPVQPGRRRKRPAGVRVPKHLSEFIVNRLIELRDVDDILERDMTFYQLQ